MTAPRVPTFQFLRDNAPWLAAGAMLFFLSSFGQTFFISIFAAEIRGEFGLSHGQWGGIYTLGTSASALLMIWAGGLTDRFRVRALGAVVLSMLAASCLLMALNGAAWMLPFVIFALRFCGQGMTSHISVVAMSRWFVAARGRALSIATSGFSVGEALLPLLFVWLLTLFDWRTLWIGAACVAILGIPALFSLLRHERTPQSFAETESSLGMEGRHWTRNQALRQFLFWMMIPAMLGPAAFNTAFFFHQVHYAEVKGISHLELVSLFPLFTGMTIGFMVLSGWALDRFGTARLMPFVQVPMAIGFVFFSQAEGLPGLITGFFFAAMGNGGMMTVPNAFWADFYGTRNIGSVKAMVAAVMVLGSALGPGITGWGIDAGIGIERQYLAVSLYFLIATGFMLVGVTRARRLLPAAA
ncbi:MFS transporter [Rhodalgimonas zhirmunskyi]|uniref:MFS transporter n=1 Tax=Rhodalgimonas zhirmunskyi TaxID=2964767 RepID=A0AAJ1U9K9_9RHOB|nr:MFS transporter [Rhodoalgimonas zhirmunskyi]MDQ2094320.1 MFS transporter [Rhodoalgimonas zhirmunskyi]